MCYRAAGELDPLITRNVNNKACLEFLHKHLLPPGVFVNFKRVEESLTSIIILFCRLRAFGWSLKVMFFVGTQFPYAIDLGEDAKYLIVDAELAS